MSGPGPQAAFVADETGAGRHDDHDYKRNGTVDLFAAMNLPTGQVVTEFRKTHKGGDVLRFFNQIDVSVRGGLSVHVVLDNLSAPSAPEVAKWLAHKDRRRWHLHFTPTSSSWPNFDRTVVQGADRQSPAAGTVHQRR